MYMDNHVDDVEMGEVVGEADFCLGEGLPASESEILILEI